VYALHVHLHVCLTWRRFRGSWAGIPADHSPGTSGDPHPGILTRLVTASLRVVPYKLFIPTTMIVEEIGQSRDDSLPGSRQGSFSGDLTTLPSPLLALQVAHLSRCGPVRRSTPQEKFVLLSGNGKNNCRWPGRIIVADQTPLFRQWDTSLGFCTAITRAC